MAQPSPYVRRYNFTNFSTLTPSAQQPGANLDAEFNAIKVTSDQTLANLKLIQRDDGQLGNLTVGTDQLKTEVSIGLNQPVAWQTGVTYAVNSTVVVNSLVLYRCLVAHTAGTFATDLAAGKWLALLDVTAAVASTGTFVTGSFTGDGVTTAFNLGFTIADPARVLWTENGTIKFPTVDYTVSGTTLTRLAAPGGGVTIRWRLFGSSSAIVPGGNTVSSWQIQDSSITNAKIVDATITGAKLAASTVTQSNLANNSVGAAQIIDASIATAELADQAVTDAKLALQPEQTLAASTIFDTTADLSTTTSQNVVVTGGSYSLSALGVLSAGRFRRLRFTGVNTLVHNASTLPLPGNANITVASGDVIELLSQGGGSYTVINFKRSDGTAVNAGAGAFPFPSIYLR